MIDFTQIQTSIHKALQSEIVQGGLILTWFWTFLGVLWYYFRQIPVKIFRLIHRYSTVHMNINKGEPYFNAVMVKLLNLHGSAGFGMFFSLYCQGNLVRIPGGVRWHRRGFSFIVSSFSERQLEHSNSSDAVTHSIRLSVFGFNKKKNLDSFLEEAQMESKDPKKRLVKIFNHDYWQELQHLPERDVKSIITDFTDEIVDDLSTFIDSEDWYREKGIPYRRGIALAGPPGTGKTSLCISLANELEKDLCLMSLKSASSTSLREAFSVGNALIVIEDIDDENITKSRDSKRPMKPGFPDELKDPDSGFSFISLSDVLNAIDGVTTGHGNILIVTTNHLDSLDPALIRPGRIDRIFKIGYLSQESFDKLCQIYYGKTCGFEVPDNLTAATVQGVFIKNKDSIEDFERELWTNHSQT